MEPLQCSETLLNISSETNGIETDVLSMLAGIEAKLFGASETKADSTSISGVGNAPQEPMLERSLLSARTKANRISSIVSSILNRI